MSAGTPDVAKVKRGKKGWRRAELMAEAEERYQRGVELAEWIEARVAEDRERYKREGWRYTDYKLYEEYAYLTIDTPRRYWV